MKTKELYLSAMFGVEISPLGEKLLVSGVFDQAKNLITTMRVSEILQLCGNDKFLYSPHKLIMYEYAGKTIHLLLPTRERHEITTRLASLDMFPYDVIKEYI